MTKEVMKQALDALNESGLRWPNIVEAIKALEEALKQEQGEPETLNYTVSVECKRCGSHEKYDLEVDYPPPQQRKPLTRKDIDRLHEEDCFSGNIYEITAEIEAAHGIKE